jgi:hypothetical protein
MEGARVGVAPGETTQDIAITSGNWQLAMGSPHECVKCACNFNSPHVNRAVS